MPVHLSPYVGYLRLHCIKLVCFVLKSIHVLFPVAAARGWSKPCTLCLERWSPTGTVKSCGFITCVCMNNTKVRTCWTYVNKPFTLLPATSYTGGWDWGSVRPRMRRVGAELGVTLYSVVGWMNEWIFICSSSDERECGKLVAPALVIVVKYWSINYLFCSVWCCSTFLVFLDLVHSWGPSQCKDVVLPV